MAEEVISFFDCTPVPQEPQISVLSDVSDGSGKSGYTLIAGAARQFAHWLTVTAEWFRRTVVHTVFTRLRNAFRMTGVQILRKCVILRF